MGACLCKNKRRSGARHNGHNGADSDTDESTGSSSSTSSATAMASQYRYIAQSILGPHAFSGSNPDLMQYAARKTARHTSPSNASSASSTTSGSMHSNSGNNNNRMWSLQNKLSMHADRLVVETLESIRPTVLNEPSNAMQKLHLISETEIGWFVVITSLINKVDLEHPFGSALILLILEDAPLPTRKSIMLLEDVLELQMQRERSVAKQRNISIVLGCLAEKLAGTLSSVLFSESVQNYLLSRIEPCNSGHVILYSLIALEKFSQTIDNKLLVVKRLDIKGPENPLLKLEKLIDSADLIEQQVGFCAKWHLDNYFLYDNRLYTYETIDRDNLNVMLNSKDASENLKISADGLTARNDTSRFESVRCTFAIISGCYYYETLLITPGVMQIGFATKQSRFLNHDGFGIGDDDQSIAYDGCRQLLWQSARSVRTQLPRWKEGDVVGCLIDLDKFEIRFSLNGVMGEPNTDLFKNKPLSTQYYAAASFMPFQQCVFNFGRVPFIHPPENYNFRTFNQCATLTEDEKTIMPRHLILRRCHSSNLLLNTCTICCDNAATVALQPCDHNGFCETCAGLLDNCPLCRKTISSRKIC